MGFGILFLGYFITYIMALNTFGAAFRFAGYLIMAYSAKKLVDYCEKFVYAEYTALLLSLMSAARVVDEIFPIFNGIVADVFMYSEAAAILVYHVFLLLAIKTIAKDTDVDKIQISAMRNLFFIGLYYLLYIIGMLPLPIKELYSQTMGLPILLLNLAWIILNLCLIVSCYSHICDEGDVEMERKPSRFAFINNIRAELDAKQARARERDAIYKKEKAERRAERKRNKNK